MMLGTFTKQPAEIIDYDVDYTDWLDGTADSVLSATVTIVSSLPADATPLTDLSTYINTQRVKMWMSGGTNGATYKITVKATTTNGRIKEDEFKIKCKDF